jgi:hypothetical protein
MDLNGIAVETNHPRIVWFWKSVDIVTSALQKGRREGAGRRSVETNALKGGKAD